MDFQSSSRCLIWFCAMVLSTKLRFITGSANGSLCSRYKNGRLLRTFLNDYSLCARLAKQLLMGRNFARLFRYAQIFFLVSILQSDAIRLITAMLPKLHQNLRFYNCFNKLTVLTRSYNFINSTCNDTTGRRIPVIR